jgi:hypothetical protein
MGATSGTRPTCESDSSALRRVRGPRNCGCTGQPDRRSTTRTRAYHRGGHAISFRSRSPAAPRRAAGPTNNAPPVPKNSTDPPLAARKRDSVPDVELVGGAARDRMRRRERGRCRVFGSVPEPQQVSHRERTFDPTFNEPEGAVVRRVKGRRHGVPFVRASGRDRSQGASLRHPIFGGRGERAHLRAAARCKNGTR